jgi:hypothetical protein
MQWQTKAVLIVLSGVAMMAGAQSSAQDQNKGQETQARGYWVDPLAGLMWTAKDNGENINWHKATKYCRNLRTGGYTDWRLPAIEELQEIKDERPHGPKPVPKGTEWAMEGWENGGLLVTGPYQWSSSRRMDDRGHTNGYAWYFSFNNDGIRDSDPLGYEGGKRALCVRRP